MNVKVAIYDDMVEITSPGLLPPSIDYSAMTSRQSDARNKTLAGVFKKLGIIDQWGNGVTLIAEELKQYPNVRLVWQEVGMFFQVQFVLVEHVSEVANPLSEREDEVSDITNEYVILNVALLTQIDKYTELYVLNEGKQYKVENGQAKVELTTGFKNKLMVYGKENGSLNNLGATINVEAAKLVPTELSMSLNIIEKNGEKLIEIYYKYNNKNSVKKIEFVYNENEVSTYNGKAYVVPSQEFLNSLNGLDINVTINASEYLGDQEIIFEDIVIEYTLNFIFNEILFSTNNFIQNIFK